MVGQGYPPHAPATNCCSDGVMDQVERALLVVSGDAKSSSLVADPQVRLVSSSHHALIPIG